MIRGPSVHRSAARTDAPDKSPPAPADKRRAGTDRRLQHSDLGRRRPIGLVIDDQNLIVRYSEPVDLPGKIERRALASGARNDGRDRHLCNAFRPEQRGEARLGQDRQSFGDDAGAHFRAQRLRRACR